MEYMLARHHSVAYIAGRVSTAGLEFVVLMRVPEGGEKDAVRLW